MSKPSVTVLMPVYNGEKFLDEAIRSILGQTFNDFELLIVNDGSTDNTKEIIKKYEIKDKRIKVINHSKNRGLIEALNEGLIKAHGKIIARMDADDISKPERFEKQLDFMQENPDCILVGSNFDAIDENGDYLGTHQCFVGDNVIKKALLFEGCIPHPTAMFIKEVAIESGGYRKEYYPAEDYDLWRRMSKLGALHNIPESLLRYRLNTKGISSNLSNSQVEAAERIRKELWEDKSTFRLLRKRLSHSGLFDNEYLPSVIKLHKSLIKKSIVKGNAYVTLTILIDLAIIRMKAIWQK